MSISSTRSESPLVFLTTPNAESVQWVSAWKSVLAKGASVVVPVRSGNAGLEFVRRYHRLPGRCC